MPTTARGIPLRNAGMLTICNKFLLFVVTTCAKRCNSREMIFFFGGLVSPLVSTSDRKSNIWTLLVQLLDGFGFRHFPPPPESIDNNWLDCQPAGRDLWHEDCTLTRSTLALYLLALWCWSAGSHNHDSQDSSMGLTMAEPCFLVTPREKYLNRWNTHDAGWPLTRVLVTRATWLASYRARVLNPSCRLITR